MKIKYLVLIIILSVFAQSVLAKNPFEEKTFKTPVREISIITTDDGYYPNKIMAFTGEKVRFFITSTAGTKQCFILQRHEVFVAAEKGKINEAHVTLDQPGRFKFYCPSSNNVGHLTVFEKFKVEEKVESREPASTGPSHWLPRDYD